MPNYARIAANVAKALKKSGSGVVLSKAVPDDYDPATGFADELGPAKFTGSAIRGTYSVSEINGTRIREGDARFYIALDDPTAVPETGDGLVVGSQLWRVASVTIIKPGDTTLLYDVQARQR